MQKTINETNRRRKVQEDFNKLHGITPKPLQNKNDSYLVRELNPYKLKRDDKDNRPLIVNYDNPKELKKMINHTKREMQRMAKSLNFIEASRLRDELHVLEKNLKEISERK